MRTHGTGKEVAKDDGSGIVGSICVYFANGSLVFDLNRNEGGKLSVTLRPDHSRFSREGGVLTSPVVVYVSHDEKFSPGVSLFLLECTTLGYFKRLLRGKA